jgi:hypothetical protein
LQSLEAEQEEPTAPELTTCGAGAGSLLADGAVTGGSAGSAVAAVFAFGFEP